MMVKANKWMNCDDLQLGFHQFSSAVPEFGPAEVHVVMWERVSTTTVENIQQICDDLEEDFCDVSSNDSTSLYARNNVISGSIQKESHETFKGLEVKTAKSKRRKLNYLEEASEGHTEFDSSVSDASQSSDASESRRNNDFLMLSSKALGRTHAKEDESEDIPEIIFPTPVKKSRRLYIDKYYVDHYSKGGGSSYSIATYARKMKDDMLQKANSSSLFEIMAERKTDKEHNGKKESIGKTAVEGEENDKMSSTEFLESNTIGFEELKYSGDGTPENVSTSLVTDVSEPANYLNDINIFPRDTVTPSDLTESNETVQLVTSANVKCFEKEQLEKQLYFKQRSCCTSSKNQNISKQITTRSTERVAENHTHSDSSSDHDASLLRYASEPTRSNVLTETPTGAFKETFASDAEMVKGEVKTKTSTYPDVKLQSFLTPFSSFSYPKVPWFSTKTDETSSSAIETEKLQRSDNLKRMLENIFTLASPRPSVSKEINASEPIPITAKGKANENEKKERMKENSHEGVDCMPCVKFSESDRTTIMKFEDSGLLEATTADDDDVRNIREEDKRKKKCFHSDITPHSFKRPFRGFSARPWFSMEADRPSKDAIEKLQRPNDLKMMLNNIFARASSRPFASEEINSSHPVAVTAEGVQNKQEDEKEEYSSWTMVESKVAKRKLEWEQETAQKAYKSSVGNMKQMSLENLQKGIYEDLHNGIGVSSNKLPRSPLEVEETEVNEHSEGPESNVGSAVDKACAGTDFPKSITIQIPNDTLKDKCRMLGIKHNPKNKMVNNMKFLLKTSRTPYPINDIAYQPVVLVKRLDSDSIRDTCEKLKNKLRSKKTRKSRSAESSERNQKLAMSRSKSANVGVSGKTTKDSRVSQKKSKSTVKKKKKIYPLCVSTGAAAAKMKKNPGHKSNSNLSRTIKAKINPSCETVRDEERQIYKSRKTYSETMCLYKSTKQYSNKQGFRALPSYSLGISEGRPKAVDKLEVEGNYGLWTDDSSSTNHIDEYTSERAVENVRAEEKTTRTQKWENQTPKKLVMNCVEQVESSPEINAEKKLPAAKVVKKQKIYLHIHTYRLARLKDLKNTHTD